MWGTDDKPAFLPKTKGTGIMVSRFLRLSEEQHTEATELDSDFPAEARDSLRGIGQVLNLWHRWRRLQDCRVEVQSSHAFYLLWVFGQSSCHKTFAADALNASRMNARPGGAQPLYSGQEEHKPWWRTVAKGLRKVLEERGDQY